MAISIKRAVGLAILFTIFGFGIIEDHDGLGCDATPRSATEQRR